MALHRLAYVDRPGATSGVRDGTNMHHREYSDLHTISIRYDSRTTERQTLDEISAHLSLVVRCQLLVGAVEKLAAVTSKAAS